jgi:ceramide glucosyltransferase
LGVAAYATLGFAALPFVYYLLALYSTARFFSGAKKQVVTNSDFTPPLSNLKPVRGLDPGAYESFASYCRQDYPEYEIIFCVDREDPAAAVIEKLKNDFPSRRIRVLYGAGREMPNDKVARLSRLVREAKYEVLVLNDSDVAVEQGYFRTLVAPLQDPKVGAVTCLHVLAKDTTFIQRLQSVGMLSDFYPGVFVARQLDGVKFALGPTIATTKGHLASFGGYDAIGDRPAEDLHVGRFIAEQGYEVVLLPYTVKTDPDFQSLGEFVNKRLRWMTSMRHLRSWGHLGLIFTFGLPWAVAAILIHPTWTIAAFYLGGYLAFRFAMTWLVGGWGMKEKGIWKQIPMIVLWDAQAFVVWLISFLRRNIRWRGIDYRFQNGKFLRVEAKPVPK